MRPGNIAVYLLCACLLLTGCSAAEKDTTTSALGFTLEGTRIVMHARAEALLGALGSPMQYTEAASCAHDGIEKTYYYGSFYLTTYPSEEGDRIGSLWFADDTVATEEGIRIGSTRQEVADAWGEAAFPSPDRCVLTDGNCTLTILLTEDTVTSVLYEAVFRTH